MFRLGRGAEDTTSVRRCFVIYIPGVSSRTWHDTGSVNIKGAMLAAPAFIVFLLTLLSVYVFALLHQHAHAKRRRWGSRALRKGDLATISDPYRIFYKSLVVRKLASKRLSAAFYDRERVDKSRCFLLHSITHPTVEGHEDIIFVAHASRSASTLLCRLLEVYGNTCTFREPSILTLLLRDATKKTIPESTTEFALAKAVIHSLVLHTEVQRKQYTVIKLPSLASKTDMLHLLSLACPNARRIYVHRNPRDIFASLERDSLQLGIKVTPLDEITKKQKAASAWASNVIEYNDIVGDEQVLTRLCLAVGFDPPTPRQISRMRSAQTIDAKTGEWR